MWEFFRDASYYDMVAVRKTTERAFNQAIHVSTESEAEYLISELNKLEKMTSDNSEYVTPTAKLQQLRELLKQENYLPAKVVDLVNDNFWELL